MDLDDTRLRAAQAALNRMFRRDYFDICAIDQIIEMLAVVPDRETYAILRSLHCVHYSDMDRELYTQLPGLVQRALGGPVRHGVLLSETSEGKNLCIVPERAVDIRPVTKRFSLLNLLKRG